MWCNSSTCSNLGENLNQHWWFLCDDQGYLEKFKSVPTGQWLSSTLLFYSQGKQWLFDKGCFPFCIRPKRCCFTIILKRIRRKLKRHHLKIPNNQILKAFFSKSKAKRSELETQFLSIGLLSNSDVKIMLVQSLVPSTNGAFYEKCFPRNLWVLKLF